MSFATPSLLFLLWLVPALGAWWYWMERARRSVLHERMSAPLRRRLCPPSDAWRFVTQLACTLVGLALLVVALARPQWGTREEKVYQRGRDLMIALDVSRSMLARDVHPDRLGRAKADLVDLIRELRGDRAGLMAFRGKASLLCPLTTDYAYLKQAMDGVSIHSAPRGTTNIGDAIRRALDAFESDVGAHKAIILISDGEDLSGTAEDAAQAAADRGIPIFAVGLGNSDGARIPSQEKRGDFLQHDGKEVVTRLEHGTLEAIARITGGAYLPVGRAGLADSTLGTIYRQHMSQITAQDLEERVRRRRIERYQIFLLPAVILFLATGVLSRGRLATDARRSRQRVDSEVPAARLRSLKPPPAPLKPITLLLACLLPVAAGLAETNQSEQLTATNAVVDEVPAGRSGAWIAQKRYRLGNFRAAAKAYEAAAEGATRDSQETFMYNAAVCYFRAKAYDQAVDILGRLTEQGGRDQADVHYNRAAALYQQAKVLDGQTADDRQHYAELISEAAADLLAAYRRRPDEDQYRRNLAIVESDMFRSREEARRAALLEQYQEADAFAVANEILESQREILERFPVAFTNQTPERIEQIEALAARQRENADRMIPLKAKLEDVLSQNPDDAQTASRAEDVHHFLDAMHVRLDTSARRLRDLGADAYEPAARAEGEVYGLWKSMAPVDAILREDLYRQTNAIRATAPLVELATPAVRRAIRLQQEEARNLTDRFTKQFNAENLEAVQAMAGSDIGGTNQVLSAEEQRKILDLAARTRALQDKALELLDQDSLSGSLAAQRESYARLQEIERLLPKRDQQQQSQQQSQDQDKSDPQKSDADDQQQAQPNEDQDPSPEEQDQASEPEQAEEESPQDEQEASAPEPEEEMDMEDVMRLLQQALLREQEHRQEQERRRQHYDFPGMDRDW